jgi:flavorubredoxin
MFPTMADVLSYLKGLRRRSLIGAAFGSYGWAGESIKQVHDALVEMGVSTLEPVKCQYVPDAASLAAAYDLGRKISTKLKEPR